MRRKYIYIVIIIGLLTWYSISEYKERVEFNEVKQDLLEKDNLLDYTQSRLKATEEILVETEEKVEILKQPSTIEIQNEELLELEEQWREAQTMCESKPKIEEEIQELRRKMLRIEEDVK